MRFLKSKTTGHVLALVYIDEPDNDRKPPQGPLRAITNAETEYVRTEAG